MKNRIFLLLLACVLCCTMLLVSCGQVPAIAISRAIDKTAALDSYAAKMEMVISMITQGSGSSRLPMTIDMKVQNAQSEKPIFSADVYMKVSSFVGVEMVMYGDGEWVYARAMGKEFKMRMENADEEYDYTNDVSSMMQVLPELLFADVTYESGENGGYTATVDIPEATFKTVFADLVAQTAKRMTPNSVSELKIKDAKVGIVVEDGYLEDYVLQFTMDMVAGGKSILGDVEIKIAYQDPGQPVTVTPIEGCEAFPERKS